MHSDGEGIAQADAHQARQTALKALELEKSNKKLLEYIQLRQTILEEMLGKQDDVSEEIHAREVAARKIEIPEHLIGDTVIPEGYSARIEDGHVIFEPVS